MSEPERDHAAAAAAAAAAGAAAAAAAAAAAVVVQTLSDSVHEIKATVDDIHKRLFVGNGEPSITIKIDRLEEKQKARNKHFVIVYTGLVGAFFLVFLEWWVKRGPQIIK